ncbi:MAG: hypothetical protein ACT4OV_13420, partial [Microthrixaceae bacterium]
TQTRRVLRWRLCLHRWHVLKRPVVEVVDEDVLLRRVFDREGYLEWHDDLGRFVPSLAGVQFDPDGMSTFIDRVLLAGGDGRDSVATIGGVKSEELVYAVRAGDVRNLGLGVEHTPNDETPIGYAHASVTPPDGTKKPDRGTRNDLAAAMTCVFGEPTVTRPPA